MQFSRGGGTELVGFTSSKADDHYTGLVPGVSNDTLTIVELDIGRLNHVRLHNPLAFQILASPQHKEEVQNRSPPQDAVIGLVEVEGIKHCSKDFERDWLFSARRRRQPLHPSHNKLIAG